MLQIKGGPADEALYATVKIESMILQHQLARNQLDLTAVNS